MKKDIFIALAWGNVAGIFCWVFESAVMVGQPDMVGGIIIAPLLEEFTKFIGFRSVRRYSILVAASFAVSEIALHVFGFYTRSGGLLTGGGAIIGTVYLAGIGLMQLRHVTSWSVGWLVNFNWLALPAAIAVHMVWNLTEPTALDTPPEYGALFALYLIPMFLVLMKWQHEDEWWGKLSNKTLVAIIATISSVTITIMVAWSWIKYFW